MKTINSLLVIAWAIFMMYSNPNLTFKSNPILMTLSLLSLLFGVVNIVTFLIKRKN